MKSPFADCEAIPFKERRKNEFRGETFEYYYIGWKCPISGEVFATEEQEDVTMLQIFNQYRDKHNIPYDNEIKELRIAYGVSALKMSQILGWGNNQYRLYEKGEIPNLNNGKQLRAIQNPIVFCNYVDLSNLSQREKDTIKNKALNSVFAVRQDGKLRFIQEEIFGKEEVKGKFQGYTEHSLDKLKNVMLFFIGKSNRMFQTQMNKLLFYSDFLCYKENGHGITGLSYIAHNFGPVPKNWEKVFCLFDEIDNDIINCGNGNEGHILKSKITYDDKVFSEKEKLVLSKVYERFGNLTPSKISELSHKENAWIDNINGHNIIDYSYAFDLKMI